MLITKYSIFQLSGLLRTGTLATRVEQPIASIVSESVVGSAVERGEFQESSLVPDSRTDDELKVNYIGNTVCTN